MSYLSIGMSPGNVISAPHWNKIDRKLKVVELSLRCLISGLCILSAVLVGTDSEVKTIFTVEKRAKFTSMKALVLLVVADGIAAVYSLFHVLRCIKGWSLVLNKTLSWAIFSGDQIMAYLMLGAAAAAAQAAALGETGQREMHWMKICDMYTKFCNQIGEGIAGALVACLSMAALSWISAFNLFRWYGGGRRNSNRK